MKVVKKCNNWEEIYFQKIEWILFPICGNKTRIRIRDNTVLENFPLFCPKCQAGNIDWSKEFTYSCYLRARHTDVEPMNK